MSQELDYVKVLRPYQREAADRMIQMKRVLMADVMGTGKTLTTLVAIEEGHRANDAYSFVLIVCPKFALYVWHEEIRKWLGEEAIVYSGNKKQRAKIATDIKEKGCTGFVISTYGMLEELNTEFKRNAKYTAVIADEIHNGGLLKHSNITHGKFWNLLKEHKVETYYLLTGTPIRQGVTDMFGPLNLLDRSTFNSWWSFVNRYCNTIEGPFGKSIERRPKDVPKFRKMLEKYMIRRTLDEIKSDLPGKQRQCIFVEMTPVQETMYTELMEDFITVYNDEVVMAPNQMGAIMKARQLLCCPKIIDESFTYGGAVESIGEMTIDKLSQDEPVVIFTPFRGGIKYMQQYLEEKYPHKINFYVIQGGLKAEEFASQWQGFQKDEHYSEGRKTAKVLLCNTKSGAAFHATTASSAFFLGYEWDFNLNEQCEDRLNRIGQTKPVSIYYAMYKGTVDEDIASRLNDKKDAADWVIGDQQAYQVLLKRFGIDRLPR